MSDVRSMRRVIDTPSSLLASRRPTLYHTRAQGMKINFTWAKSH